MLNKKGIYLLRGEDMCDIINVQFEQLNLYRQKSNSYLRKELQTSEEKNMAYDGICLFLDCTLYMYQK